MERDVFIRNFREAFGDNAELPVGFWYSDQPVGRTEKINGCFFKSLTALLEGEPVSLSGEAVGCMGGRLYTGFGSMHERIPEFVSLKERYKKTPEMVKEFIDKLNVPLAEKTYLNLARIDRLEGFDQLEGVVFFATPDVLSGLTTWAFFDNNSDDAVTARFGSGCSAIFSETVVENRKNGRRTFLGLFDPSARPFVEPDVLSFAIPLSRFREMYHTMRACCLFDTRAWSKIRERIEGEDII